MEIIYISPLASQSYIDKVYRITKKNPGFAVQKFSRLIVSGLLKNDVNCNVFSCPPITDKEYFVKGDEDYEDGISYKYISYFNFPIIKHLCVLISTFFYVLKWSKHNTNNKAIICDVLYVSMSIGALLASKVSRIKAVAVVTDIYDLIVGGNATKIERIKKKVASWINKCYVKKYSSYVLLTEAMNEVVNPKKKPYIVMEAICDEDLTLPSDYITPKANPRIIMYAGGLEEKYGLKMLVDAFKNINDENWELHLYGSGSYEQQLLEDISTDLRIKYWGVMPNSCVVKAEQTASILVNPRFSFEEFTKYSFPSKNMEYMVSGTPVLTTKLPGMPMEYYPYVYTIDDETLSGFIRTLKLLFAKSNEDLQYIGKLGKEFVLKNKNNYIQASKIIDLIDVTN